MYFPHEPHWKAIKTIIWYVSITKKIVLWYKAKDFENLEACIYVDWVGILDDRNITSRYALFFDESLIS